MKWKRNNCWNYDELKKNRGSGGLNRKWIESVKISMNEQLNNTEAVPITKYFPILQRMIISIETQYKIC